MVGEVLDGGDLRCRSSLDCLSGYECSTTLGACVARVQHDAGAAPVDAGDVAPVLDAAVIDAAGPRLAVVSAGRDNDYGHPHPRILDHLRTRGIPLVRTDEHGSAYILREGDRLRAVPAEP